MNSCLIRVVVRIRVRIRIIVHKAVFAERFVLSTKFVFHNISTGTKLVAYGAFIGSAAFVIAEDFAMHIVHVTTIAQFAFARSAHHIITERGSFVFARFGSNVAKFKAVVLILALFRITVYFHRRSDAILGFGTISTVVILIGAGNALAQHCDVNSALVAQFGTRCARNNISAEALDHRCLALVTGLQTAEVIVLFLMGPDFVKVDNLVLAQSALGSGTQPPRLTIDVHMDCVARRLKDPMTMTLDKLSGSRYITTIQMLELVLSKLDKLFTTFD